MGVSEVKRCLITGLAVGMSLSEGCRLQIEITWQENGVGV